MVFRVPPSLGSSSHGLQKVSHRRSQRLCLARFASWAACPGPAVSLPSACNSSHERRSRGLVSSRSLCLAVLVIWVCLTSGCLLTEFPNNWKRNTPPPHSIGKDSPRPQISCLPLRELPASFAHRSQKVSTVNDLETAKSRPITLQECFALALENGRTGGQFDRAGVGQVPRLATVSNQGTPTSTTDSLRVFAFDPAISANQIPQAFGRWDPRWLGQVTWTQLERPVSTVLQDIIANQEPGIVRQLGFLSTSLVQPLPTGGILGMTYSTEYELTNQDAPVNPAYRPKVEIGFEHPILRGAGWTINQLLEGHPPNLRLGYDQTTPTPSLFIARVSFRESRLELDRRLSDLLFAVEKAYWELHFSYWNQYSRSLAFRQVAEALDIAKRKFDEEEFTIQSLAEIQEQYQKFRVQRLQTLGNGVGGTVGILEAERQLRHVIGLPVTDGVRLIPIDRPMTVPIRPNLSAGIEVALEGRSEILQTREEVCLREALIRRIEDSLLPDLRFVSQYNVNALGNRLDGPSGALANLADTRFHDWTLGFQMEVPLGFRSAKALWRAERLRLAQLHFFHQNQKQLLTSSLVRVYREIVQLIEEMEIQEARLEAAETQVKARYKLFVQGDEPTAFLEAQRNWADAIRDVHFTIYRYNLAWLEWYRQQGVLLESHGVHVIDEEVPHFVTSHASEYLQQRTKKLEPETTPRFLDIANDFRMHPPPRKRKSKDKKSKSNEVMLGVPEPILIGIPTVPPAVLGNDEKTLNQKNPKKCVVGSRVKGLGVTDCVSFGSRGAR